MASNNIHGLTDMQKRVSLFRQAVEANINNTKLSPLPDQVHLQVMPEAEQIGNILTLQTKAKITDNPMRYGTVLNVGENVKHLKPGDDVIFEHKWGRRFGGMYNPLQTGTDHDWEDELRIINGHEIIGVVEYELTGKEVSFFDQQGAELTGVVEDECPAFGGLVSVRVEEGVYWVKPEDILD